MVLQRTIPLAASLSAASLSAAALLAAGLCVGACSSGGTHGEGVVDSSVSSDVAIDAAGAPGAIEVDGGAPADGAALPGDALGGSPSGDPGTGAGEVDAPPDTGTDGGPVVEDAELPPGELTPQQAADLALTEAVFQADRLLDIHIDMDPADWDALRAQTRTVLDVLGPGCLDAPPESPFTYFDATITVDGETTEHVGVRKKGFLGSMSTVKPALKVKFGEYVKDQTWQGMRRMTLNNSVQDPAIVRQCLAYGVFARAGLPTPRCNYAMVTVNGTYLGPFVHVESLRKPFLRRAFGSDDGLFWEGTLSDFREGWDQTFQPKSTDHPSPSNAPLEALVAAVQVPDEELEAALEAVMVLDEFFTFWAAEVLTTHWDGYSGNTNNFYLYADPGADGRLRFVPWGVDGTFRLPDPAGPQAVMLTGVLAKRLYEYPPTRARYFARLAELLDGAWDEAAMQQEITATMGVLDPAIDPPYTAPWIAEVNQVREVVEQRRATLQADLAEGGYDWSFPLRANICMVSVGDVVVSFETSWDTLGAENPFAVGSATATGSIDGEPVAYEASGAIAGVPTEGPDAGRVILGSLFWLGQDEGIVVLVLNLAPGDFVAGVTLPIGGGQVGSGLIYIDPATGEGQSLGFLLNATLQIDAADQTPGGAVKGKVVGSVFRFGGVGG